MSNLFDLVIKLGAAFLVLGLLTMLVTEMIASVFALRGRYLARAISLMLGIDLKDYLYQHPLIKTLNPTGPWLPAYIPDDKFALALMDIVVGKDRPANDPVALRKGIVSLPEQTKMTLAALLSDSSGRTDQRKIQGWFSDVMNRLSGNYKRTIQMRMFVLAFIVAGALNLDALRAAQQLWNEPTARAAKLELVKAAVKKQISENPTVGLREATAAIEASIYTERPFVGWSGQSRRWRDLFAAMLGWFVTALAVTLASSFSFDYLGKYINVRSDGIPPGRAG